MPEFERFIGYMNLLKTNQSINKGEIFYVDYKISKNATTIRVFFRVSLIISVRKKLISKAFSMFEIDIDQIPRLKIYKNLHGW